MFFGIHTFYIIFNDIFYLDNILTLDNNHLGDKTSGYNNACLCMHILVSLPCRIYMACTPGLRQLLPRAMFIRRKLLNVMRCINKILSQRALLNTAN